MFDVKILKVISLVVLSVIKCVESLQCYSCQNIIDHKTCNTTVTCNSGEVCYQNSGYNSASKAVSVSMGCIANLHCSSGTSSGSSDLVGRGLNKRQDEGCQKCCATDRCNYDICFHQKPHGVWKEWSEWSMCSVSCGIGMQRRQRNCSNQLPGTQEYHCVGLNLDDRLCKPGACYDGGWSNWGSWTSCSVTCGDGFYSRSRTCSNPRPSSLGRYCDGQPIQVSSCKHVKCEAHGVWKEWSGWSKCSVSCGIGMQRRQRNCSNQLLGTQEYHCVGLNLDDRLCKPGACYDGGWNNWGSWTSCSVTCGDGFHSRSRNCSNPRPSPLGRYCDGQPIQVSSCNNAVCEVSGGKNTNVMFSSRGFTTMGYKVDNGTVFVYTTATINEGNGYNSTSGIFTVPLAGFYSFSVQICSPTSKNGAFGIFVNGVNIKPAPYGNNGIILCLTTDVVTILKKGDRVWTQCIDYTCYMRGDGDKYWNTFSGYLVHK